MNDAMIRLPRFAALVASVLATAPLAAQGGNAAAAAQAPACDVDQMQPQTLAIAALGRSKVVGAKTPDDAQKGIRDALKNVFDAGSSKNALGRDYLAAQYFMLAIEYGGEVQTRGNLGMPGDKAATIDLVVAADSLLTSVEKAKPGCKDEIIQWREYKPFAGRVQAAYKVLQAAIAEQDPTKKAAGLDSAERSANRAMILSKNAPQPYDINWRIKQARGDEDGTISFLKLAIEKLAADTSNARIRSNLMFNMGRMQQQFADKASEPRKSQLYKGAGEAYVSVMKEMPASAEAPFAVNGVSVVWALSKDSTVALQGLAQCKANMAKFNDLALAQCGVIATRLTRGADAAEMFKAATAINPYSRDFLYNYAATLFDLKRSQEMLGVVNRLVAMDPSNPDNLMLYAYAYRGLSDSTKDAALKKAYLDSATAWGTKSDRMTVKLVYTSFDRGTDATQLQGEIENRDNRGPKSFNVEFEFLDKSGNVIEAKTASVGPIAPNASGTFSVDIAKGGVWGVRYKPLPYEPMAVAAEAPAAPEPPLTTKDVSDLVSVKAPMAKVTEMMGKRGCKITWNATTTAALKKVGATDAQIAQFKTACAAAKP